MSMETQLKTFVNGAVNYFETVAGRSAEVGMPYLKDTEKDDFLLDCAAVIGISGSYRGCVYYSASRQMLEALMKLSGEDYGAPDLALDFVGEIANTIAGNAQRDLGAGFLISVPVVIQGISTVRLPREIPHFIIPIKWQNYKSYIVIAISSK
ncbi:MAG: chemotaxis protein CheX [Candidatus Methylacidiphilales bacterium]|nr:chemotaxis protein CheX [Candidatus Methylacidiphilales bacterium]